MRSNRRGEPGTREAAVEEALLHRGPVDGVRITVDVTGAVEVVTGSASVGQGIETVIAQICADALGVDYKSVRVVHGRTDRIDHGFGAHAARATVMTGSATRIAALKVRAKAIEIAAADFIEANADALDVVDGKVVRTNQPDGASVTLGRIASALTPAAAIAKGREPGLSADGWLTIWPIRGVHVAVATSIAKPAALK